VPDGRTYKHARKHARTAAVTIIITLTTVGLGLATASPAAAAPDTNDIDAVQARVDRFDKQAEAAQKRHDTVQKTLTGSRGQLTTLTTGIQRQRRVMNELRAQVASTVVGEYDATGGASAPARDPLSTDSEVLLTNVTLVSEDAGQRGDALAQTNAQLAQLNQRRTAVRDQVTMLSGLERNLRVQEQKVDARAAKAGALLDRIEEKAAAERMARLGGPVLAYAKSQVGKSYVYGAAGPSSFDCSGLTMMAWSQSGVSLPHSSSAQYSSGPHISESELQPGDLVFYYSPISHVGIYIGNGQIVNALNPGSGVQVSGLHDMPYSGAVRVG
jgi:cell wall-associated NlpC family hydrolase